MHTKLKKNKKNIVILGAGFCGLHTAKRLAKRLRGNNEYQIILVDRRNVSIYSGDLYEISTAYNKRISQVCLRILQEAVSIPIRKVLMGLEVIFMKDTVTSINQSGKKIFLKDEGELEYEYLVMALGSVSNYYNIPGLAEKSYPLKTMEDAMGLNCHIDQFFHNRWTKKSHKKVNIVVGGGGFTGVEFACEIAGYIRRLAGKYSFNPKEVQIAIMQGGEEFVGLGKIVSRIAYRRFKHLGIRPMTDARITSYDGKHLTICSRAGLCKRSVPADILVWTGGVMPNPLIKNFPILHESGGLEVYPTLESPHYPKVYAGGDNAAIFDTAHHNLVPKLAQMAIQQGNLIAHNIWADIAGKKQHAYKPLFKGFIVPMGGRYFVYHKNNITFTGIIPYLMRRAVDLYYFMSVLPFAAAVKKFFHTENIFIQND